MNNNDYQNVKLGGLWLKDSKNGTKYMSGNINIYGAALYISILKNNKKENDKQPDYHIFTSIKKYDNNNNQNNNNQNNNNQDDYSDIPF